MNTHKIFVYNGDVIETGIKPLLPEHKFRTWVAVGVSVSAVSVGMGAASAAGAFSPDPQNLSASSQEMARVQAQMLPEVRRLQAAATLGQNINSLSTEDQTRLDLINQQIATLQGQLDKTDNTQTGKNVINNKGSVKKKIAELQKEASLISGKKIDFTGFGQADVQGQIMKDLAKGQLESEQKYDPQFIAAQLKQQKEADPQKFAAREALYKSIQEQIGNTPQSPVSQEMNRQVQERVHAGSMLTPEEQSMLDRAVMERGGTSGESDFSGALTTGLAGTQREMANAGAGMNWLASGTTPDDIKYRSEQQNLRNLANYYSGKTPQSQFNQLSGGSVGSTPLAQAPAMPSANMNAGQQGAAGSLMGYEQQMLQANPWMAGISSILNTGTAAIKAMQTPIAQQTPTGGI